MDYARVCKDLATLGVNCSPLQFGRAEAAARPKVSYWLHKGGSTESHGTFMFYASAILKGLPGSFFGLSFQSTECLWFFV